MPDEDVERHGSGIEVDWDEVPDSAVVPVGNYLVSVDTVEAGMSKNTGKLMYQGTFKIEEPKEYANLQLRDFYVLGSDDDPQGSDQKTVRTSIGMQRLKNLFKATSGTMGASLDACCREAEGQQVMARVTQTEDKQNKGQFRNNIQRYFPLGEREPGIDDTEDKGPRQLKGTASKRAAAPQTAKGEEGEDETAAPAAAPVKKPAPAAVKATAPAAAAAAKNGKPAPAAAAGTKKAAAEAPVEMKKCPLCDNEVPRAELKQHMLTCEEDAAGAAAAE